VPPDQHRHPRQPRSRQLRGAGEPELREHRHPRPP
jgi:hypothetical protein